MKGKKTILLLIPVAVLVTLVYIIWGVKTPGVTSSVNLAANSGFETFDESGNCYFIVKINNW